LRTSCCFSAGNIRTTSRIACSRDTINLNFIIRRRASYEKWPQPRSRGRGRE
jgi:hypothetical protein